MKTIIIHILAYSGSGKTTLIEKIIKELLKYNINVDVIKHDAHNKIININDNNYGHIKKEYEIKDSERYLLSGAKQSIINSDELTLIHNNNINKVFNKYMNVNELINLCNEDVIIIEGFKDKIIDINIEYKILKIGIKRLENNKELPYDNKYYDYIFTDDKSLIDNKKKYYINNFTVLCDYIRSCYEKYG